MSKNTFFEELGLVPSENKVVEILVPEDKVEKVVDKPVSILELSDSEQEINTLRARLLELEEKLQPEGQDAKEQLGSVNNAIAELRGEIESSPAIVQSERILETLEKLQNRLDLLKENLEIEREVAKCPDCGNIVGWNNLPAESHSGMQLKPSERLAKVLPPMFFSQYGKKCPICKHFEQVKEAKEEVKEAKKEE